MDLSEVQKEMVPGAMAALKQGISLDEAREAFTLTLFGVTLDQNANNQRIVARKLGVSEALVSQVVNDKVYTRFPRTKGSQK